MVKILLISLLLLSKVTFAQVIDHFDDGDFSKDPPWHGDVNQFIINAQKQLQSAGLNSANQSIYLTTLNEQSLNTSWTFYVELNFDPTATNFTRIYLSSNEQNLNGALNGYFIQIGEAGAADGIHLYRQTNSSISRIMIGPQKPRSSANVFMARIKVTRDTSGKWEVYSDASGGTNFVLEGSAVDDTYGDGSYFGLLCKYATASRYNQFIFDDFEIKDLLTDTIPPMLKTLTVIDPRRLELTFSKPLDLITATQLTNYSLSNNYGNPVLVVTTASSSVYRLMFAKDLIFGNYTLTLNNIKDKKGNVIKANSSLNFFHIRPYTPKKGDFLVTEVLFNPKPNEVDFVEIYNNTADILNLKELQLANVDTKGDIANKKNVTLINQYIMPGQYWVLTTKPDIVKNSYYVENPNNFTAMASLPTFNNTHGSVILLSANLVLDRLDYTEKMHMPLLRNLQGVSLERVSLTKDANEEGNFSSAASSIGYATPTYKNSQQSIGDENYVRLISKTFSPDGDGFEDALQLEYKLAQSGNLATINIYTDKGILVRKLVKNQSVGTFGGFTWDGINDAGTKCNVGVYVVVFESFDLKGDIKKYKNTCVLATKLN